jgi:hypothetical protein
MFSILRFFDVCVGVNYQMILEIYGIPILLEKQLNLLK